MVAESKSSRQSQSKAAQPCDAVLRALSELAVHVALKAKRKAVAEIIALRCANVRHDVALQRANDYEAKLNIKLIRTDFNT